MSFNKSGSFQVLTEASANGYCLQKVSLLRLTCTMKLFLFQSNPYDSGLPKAVLLIFKQ